MKQLFIYTDGGARGNPGPAAIGIVIKDDQGKTIKEISKAIGKATNNVAEYMAVLEALRWIKENLQFTTRLPAGQVYNLQFNLDSMLVVHQLNGKFKIKNQKLGALIIQIKDLEKSLNNQITYQHISRQQNQRADFLVNLALNQKSG